MPLSNSSLRRLAVTSVSLLALAACKTVGPDFHSPAEPAGAAAAGYAMAGDPAAPGIRLDPAARAAGPWWEAFGSPDLDRVVTEALASSPTVAEAKATLERYQAEARAAAGAQSPQADIAASVQRERINTQSFGFTGFPSPTINLYSVGPSVSYDLDLFGGRRRATEAAQARAEEAARQADAAYLTLSGDIALQAMTVAALRGRIAAIESVIADDQAIFEMQRKASQLGGNAPLSTINAAAQLAEDQALLPPLRKQLDQARHQLALLSGKSPAEWTAPDFDLAAMTIPADIPVELPSALVRNRPDILAAEAELHRATAQIGVATADLYPNIRLSAALTQGAIHPGDIFNYTSSGWSVLAGLSAPIFHGGTLTARKQAATAEARVAAARYQETVLRAFVQVSDALAALAADKDNIAAKTRSRELAELVLHDARAGYQLGGVTMLQLSQAQRAVSQARRDLAEAEGQRYADLVRLYAATATDWRKGS